MAILVPSLSEIENLKVQPEEGELNILRFLNSSLDDSFEVFFNPYMNGDRPDIIILRKGYGVMIIEVKDYILSKYKLDARKNFVVKSNDIVTYKSPIGQVLKYKQNLFDLHIDGLLEKKIKNIKQLKIVSCAIYFHNANNKEIKGLLVDPFENNDKYKKFLKYNVDLIGIDKLNISSFNKILYNRYMKSSKKSYLFTDDLYFSIKRFLKPPLHLKEQGEDIIYSEKQKEIIFNSKRNEQRINGVVGSGKTTILAAKAVQAHKKTKGKVLILTYNITLKNFIHDKINKVRENFEWCNFVISNYHSFINSELNNLNIDFEIPSDFDLYSEKDKNQYLEKKYYSNKKIFSERKQYIQNYDVILIDEIQDYKRPWMEILKECFLTQGGEYYLFGDVKQNIYNNSVENKDVVTNVRGVVTLNQCFRSDFKIKDLAINFQKEIFKDKYVIDKFNTKESNLELPFEKSSAGRVNYIHLPYANSITSLYTIIHENSINKEIPPNDITILGGKLSLLIKFDSYYRYLSNEKTNTMFETSEIRYKLALNMIKNKEISWIKEFFIISNLNFCDSREKEKGCNQLCVLFTLYELYFEFGDIFKNKLKFYCEKYSIKLENFLKFRDKNSEEINNFIENIYQKLKTKDIKSIRDNKKLHFWMNSGTIKISTIHSFKGWESDTLFLIIENKDSYMNMNFDEILYTGITRCRTNLVIINFGNEEYHERLKHLVDIVN
ncbi:MAG: AAA family ATPase [Marinifilaceae bacterium]|jgi:hypothetical protein|nr:AAA family ATPase [Marinifilaceae bacterium]